MIKGRNVKQMFRDCGGKLGTFSQKFRHLLGIREDPRTGRRYVDQTAKQMGVDEFYLRDLTEAFLGSEFIAELHAGPPSGQKAAVLAHALNGNITQNRLLMEDVAPVTPSIFQDISAWNASISGLVEVRLLEGYNMASYIGDDFVEVQPTRVNGGRMIGIPYPAPKHEVIAPGIEFPTIGMNELYVWARPNFVMGGKLPLERNAVVYDLSGELMAKAESIGKGLGLEREYVIACGVLGIAPLSSGMGIPQSVLNQIGASFRMNTPGLDATPNATYQTAGSVSANGTTLPNAYNYINLQTGSTGFQDWTSLQAVRQLLNLMRDPVNNLPFESKLTRLWVDPYEWDLAQRTKHATQVFNITGSPATQYGPLNQGTGSTVPPVATGSAGWPPNSQLDDWEPYTSNIWHQALLDSGVSEANARKYYLAGDPKKAFVWRSAWDARVDQANPSSSELLGRNIVNEFVTQLSGQFVVREPRYVVLTTN